MSPLLSLSPPHQVPIPAYTNKMPIDGLQFVIPQVREAAPAHFESAKISVIQSHIQTFKLMPEKF
jgi:hypothetical protein